MFLKNLSKYWYFSGNTRKCVSMATSYHRELSTLWLADDPNIAPLPSFVFPQCLPPLSQVQTRSTVWLHLPLLAWCMPRGWLLLEIFHERKRRHFLFWLRLQGRLSNEIKVILLSHINSESFWYRTEFPTSGEHFRWSKMRLTLVTVVLCRWAGSVI